MDLITRTTPPLSPLSGLLPFDFTVADEHIGDYWPWSSLSQWKNSCISYCCYRFNCFVHPVHPIHPIHPYDLPLPLPNGQRDSALLQFSASFTLSPLFIQVVSGRPRVSSSRVYLPPPSKSSLYYCCNLVHTRTEEGPSFVPRSSLVGINPPEFPCPLPPRVCRPFTTR